ncbi:hypothetical protein AOLI_G00323920 [Acnodon oligacanthus]
MQPEDNAEQLMETATEQRPQTETRYRRCRRPQPPQRRLSLRLNRELQRDDVPPSQARRLLRQTIHLQLWTCKKRRSSSGLKRQSVHFLKTSLKSFKLIKPSYRASRQHKGKASQVQVC